MKKYYMRVPLLNFEGGPGIPLLNFEGGPGPTFTPCQNFDPIHLTHKKNKKKLCGLATICVTNS